MIFTNSSGWHQQQIKGVLWETRFPPFDRCLKRKAETNHCMRRSNCRIRWHTEAFRHCLIPDDRIRRRAAPNPADRVTAQHTALGDSRAVGRGIPTTPTPCSEGMYLAFSRLSPPYFFGMPVCKAAPSLFFGHSEGYSVTGEPCQGWRARLCKYHHTYDLMINLLPS